MSYTEAQSKDLQINSSKKTYKLHCHLVAIQESPFPKLFVTDYIENDDFAARLDFLAPVDLEGAVILPENMVGIKLFEDKSGPMLDVLENHGLKLEGPKIAVFDKFIFLTLNIRLFKFQSRKCGLLLEGIMDEVELLEYDPHNVFVDQLFKRFESRFKLTPYSKNIKYRKIVKPFKTDLHLAQLASPDSPPNSIKEEDDLAESVPFGEFNSDEFDPSTGVEDEENEEEQASRNALSKISQNHDAETSLRTTQQLNRMLEARNYSLKSDEFFQVRGKVAGIYPSKIRDIISVEDDNSIKLKHLIVYIKDESSHIKVTVSNNLQILQFLIGDDFSNNSSAALLRLYYEFDIHDQKIAEISQRDQDTIFHINWGHHKICDDNNNSMTLHNWEFLRVPKIDDLVTH